MDPDEVAALAASLRALLDEVDAGRLDASPGWRARIEGAVTALDEVTSSASDRRPSE